LTASGESYRASPGAFAIKEAERRAKEEEAERAREEEAKKKEREAKEKKPANYAVLHTLETFRGQDGKIELRQSCGLATDCRRSTGSRQATHMRSARRASRDTRPSTARTARKAGAASRVVTAIPS